MQGRGCWNLTFIRHFNDWEMEEERLLLYLSEKKVTLRVDDTVWWTKTKNSAFSVKSFYKALDQRQPGPFPMKSIWSNIVQPKLCFFA